MEKQKWFFIAGDGDDYFVSHSTGKLNAEEATEQGEQSGASIILPESVVRQMIRVLKPGQAKSDDLLEALNRIDELAEQATDMDADPTSTARQLEKDYNLVADFIQN